MDNTYRVRKPLKRSPKKKTQIKEPDHENDTVNEERQQNLYEVISPFKDCLLYLRSTQF